MKYTFTTSLLLLLLFFCESSHAQDTTRHELSASVFGGQQALRYRLTGNGSASGGFGGGVGAGYAYRLNRRWSLGTGIALSYATASLDNATLQHSYTATNQSGYANDTYTFDYSVNDYHESQSALQLEVPLVVRLSVPIGATGRQAIRFSGGLQFGFPISARYSLSAGLHKTDKVYCGLEKVPYLDDALNASNGPVGKQTGSIQLSPSVQMIAEAAYRRPLTAGMHWAAGIYFSYGLNSIQKETNQPLAVYSTLPADTRDLPPQYRYNGSILNTGLVSSLRPVAIGIKLNIEFGM
jgi:hypothetical protein